MTRRHFTVFIDEGDNMKRKIIAITIMAALMLTSCSSSGDNEETTAAEPSDVEIEDTGLTVATESTETTDDKQDESGQDVKYVTFGHYEQDGDESNGPEPINWIILTEEDDRMLLISLNILDYQPYNTELEEVTWETCSLRKWLNEDFINAAFDASEQEQILTVTNTNPDNELYFGMEGGNDTEDRVFLLSIDEARDLFEDDDARACEPCEWYWLRSPGYPATHAAVVLHIGELLTRGHLVTFNYYDHGVRPALWLSIDGDGA